MMQLIDVFLHLDKYLGTIIQNYGLATYVILFSIIFSETGLVFMTFFPGDTLLFVAGTFASQGAINIFSLFILLSIAAIVGDSLNYSIGKYFGKNVIIKRNWVKQENIQKTKDFFEKHGAKTIILARFLPIIRSFAPFVAGISEMKYSRFLFYNIFGGIFWVAIMLSAGYFFGAIPFVKDNLSLFVIFIFVISWIPPILAWIKSGKRN